MTRDEQLLGELQAMREKVDDLHQYVVGKPGLPGLVARHELHEQRTTQLEKQLDRRRKLEFAGITTLVGLAIERVWALIVRGE